MPAAVDPKKVAGKKAVKSTNPELKAEHAHPGTSAEAEKFVKAAARSTSSTSGTVEAPAHQ